MNLRDLMAADGKVFLKSEFAPIDDGWPCVSYSKQSVGTRFRNEFKPDRDVLIYVGTTNAEMTEDPAHRSRLISAVVVQPGQDLKTKEVIPPKSWEESVARWGEERWQFALPVIRAAQMIGPPFPDARGVVPVAYRSLGEFAYRGNIVEVTGGERAAVMDIDVIEIQLNLQPGVRQYLAMMAAISPAVDKSVQQEISRMAGLIIDRVERGGEVYTGTNPIRHAPNVSDLVRVLTDVWKRQDGRCRICDGRILLKSGNRMLQASADRIDSGNPSYDEGNTQITHLACNLAKNQYGLGQVEEWLDVVRRQEAEPLTA